jgi:hypothetical protein
VPFSHWGIFYSLVSEMLATEIVDPLDYSPSTCSSDNGSCSGDKFTRCRFPAGPPTCCPVCGDTAFHHHFGGVVSCNGCAGKTRF